MTRASMLIILLLPIVNFTTAAAETDRDTTDRLIFSSDIATFLKARNETLTTKNSTLDFSSDGCTKVADKPLGFDFTASCQRHDFGTRNYKRQGRFTEDARERINTQFKNDMDGVCNGKDNTHTYHKNSLPSILNETAEGILTFINLLIDGYDSSGGDDSGENEADTSGDTSNYYSERVACETIAEVYYKGVSIYGWYDEITGENEVSRRYSAIDGVYFWGVYVTFLSFLIFWW
jgi:hypothetical protein